MAVDYVFGTGSGVTPFSITATDTARALGFSLGTFGTPDPGAVYWRGAASDATYAHFDLSSLEGAGISGSVNLNFTVDTIYGGDINAGQVSKANGAWSAPGAAPGFTAISGATGPNASFADGATATWTIGGSAFAGFVASPGSFPGLVVSAGADSNAHFSGLPTLTGTALIGQVTVADGTDWSAAVWNSGTSTLTVSGTSDVSGGNVAIQSGATVSMVDAATMDSGNFAGIIANAGTLSFASSAGQTLSGSISGPGALAKSGTGTLTLTGANGFSGGITIDGGSLAVSSSTFGSGPVTINNGGTLETSGQWTFGGANPWASSTNIPSVTVNTGGTLHFSEGDGFANGITNLYLNGGSVTGGGGFLVEGLGALFLYNGNEQITAGGATTSTISARMGLDGNNNIITVDDDSTLNITGVVANCTSWSNNGGFIKVGNGTLALSGTNSYTGNTTLNGGTLSLGNGTTNTALANTADVTVDSGCTLNLNYTGTDTIDELWLGGVQKSPGVYGSGNSGGLITGTGTLTVSNGPSANDYDAWGSTYGLTAGSEGDDLDDDGVKNQAEYAFGLIPNSGSSVNPITGALNKATGQFSYQRRDNGLTNLTYTVWYSTDLSAWAEDTGASQPEGSPDGNGVETINVTLSNLPGTPLPGKLFIQVRAN